MNENLSKAEYEIESSHFPDLAYQTKRRAFLSNLNEEFDHPESTRILSKVLPSASDDKLKTLLQLEQNYNIYIFKRHRTIMSIEVESMEQNSIITIFPSGATLHSSPTTSVTASKETNQNTYRLETTCIGIAVSKSDRINKIFSIALSENLRNSLNLKEQINKDKAEKNQIDQERKNIENRIKMDSRRLDNLSNEIKNAEKNLSKTQEILIEKEKEIFSAEENKQKTIEEKTTIEHSIASIKSQLESERKTKEKMENEIETLNKELVRLKDSANKLTVEIIELNQKKRTI